MYLASSDWSRVRGVRVRALKINRQANRMMMMMMMMMMMKMMMMMMMMMMIFAYGRR
jgi:hypothetical protein